jgi:hypothetical protein
MVCLAQVAVFSDVRVSGLFNGIDAFTVFFKALPALTRDNGVVDIELRLWLVWSTVAICNSR